MPDSVVVITGGSRGIGRAAALQFARSGYDVVITARRADALEQTAAEVRALDRRCVAVTADVTSADDCRRVIATATDELGRVDVLVNNAGFAPVALVDAMSDEDYRTCVSVNVDGVFFMTRAAWGVLKASRGVIVNVSSRASFDPFGGFAVYGACKAWVNLFTKATAKTGQEHGVRVFAIAPGATETEMLRGVAPDLPADQVLPPEALAKAIHAICADAWRYSSGQTIQVAL